MNDELKAKLVTYLGSLEAATKKASDFAEAEVPDVIRQWVAWEFWSAVMGATVAFLVAGALVAIVVRVVKRFGMDDTASMVCLPFGGIVAVTLVCAGVERGFCALKIAIAPKVVVVEKIATIIRGR